MTRGTIVGEWNVFFCTPSPLQANAESPIDPVFVNALLEDRRARVFTPNVPHFLDPEGQADSIINGFFLTAMQRGIPSSSGRKPRRLRPASARAYAYDTRSFLNTLHALGRSWREVDEEDIDDVRDWRLYAPDNPRTVTDSTWEGQSQALRALYHYAARFGVPNPMVMTSDDYRDQGGGYVRRSNVKWFDPAAYAQWRNVGLGGVLPDGTDNASFRGHNVQRDMAFANALYRTGLRVQECGSVLLGLEWPDETDVGRGYSKTALADACAKGGFGRPYWVPRAVAAECRAYVLGERAAAMARGQAAYVQRDDRLLIVDVTQSGALVLADGDGVILSEHRTLDSVTPSDRLRLFWDRGGMLEPAVLWLNDTGEPRDHRSWNRTFVRANQRVHGLGLSLAQMNPHYLRHSFALR